MEPRHLKMLGIGVLLGIAAGFLGGRAIYGTEHRSAEREAPSAPMPAAARPAGPAGAATLTGMDGDPASRDALHTRINLLTERAKKDPADRKARVELGDITFDNKIYDLAVKYYEEALALDGRDANVLTDAGIAYRGLGNSAKAVSYFERATQVDTRHVKSWYNMALVKLDDLHDRAGAESAVREALKIDPSFAPAVELDARIRATPI
ncbi:MAG: tetratricopeptide repeat protein [Acidobacteriota bacterium]